MKKLKQFIFKTRAKKHFAKDIREKRFVNYEQAKTIIILFESDYMEKNPFIKRIAEQFKAEGKKVSVWGFIDKKEVTSAILSDYRILNKKSCDWSEQPNESFIREITESSYDLLIDLTKSEILPLKYILLYSNVACKAGINKYDENLLDFKLNISPQEELAQTEIIEDEKSNESKVETLIDEHYIFQNIFFYLKTIQSND